jgi:DNA-binding NtrC family response regulator
MKNSRKIKVLLVDDDPDALKSQSNLLKEYGDFYVFSYDNPAKAELSVNNGLNYDIGIFDQAMSPVTGNELAQISKERNPNTPVIILSGYDQQYLKSPHFDLYVVKLSDGHMNLNKIIKKLCPY